MKIARRTTLVILVAVVIVLLFHKKFSNHQPSVRDLSQSVEPEEFKEDDEVRSPYPYGSPHQIEHTPVSVNEQQLELQGATAYYPAGQVKPAGEPYTRGIVIGRLSSENTTWLDQYMLTDKELIPYLYIVDDLSAPLHTPMNKGHEAMVYLTYIIDHYDNLPDISIFMHPHQRAWHTPELLNHDASELLKRLSSERVTREGYMNLRCHWDPGCPERLYPDTKYRDKYKREELAIGAAWVEMFPGDPVPHAIGAPCCAQFAVARHRIEKIPKANFERYRNWLIRTEETDWISGRVLEYLWHKIFANQAKLCPDAQACYCDGYGICFATSELFEKWFDNHFHWQNAMEELDTWKEKARVIDAIGDWSKIENMKLDIPIPGRNWELQEEIDERLKILVAMRTEALQNGKSPEIRAKSAGRPWKEGDGF